MIIDDLTLDGVQLLKPDIYKDNRGVFTEKLNINFLDNFSIKQINQSISQKNVFRGFHFQNLHKNKANMYGWNKEKFWTL